MLKRAFDFFASLTGLILTAPITIPVMILVWLQDFHCPFYIAPRVGKNEKLFSMVKMRSMIMNADKSGVDSTSSNDQRITGVGRFVRSYKIDELTQLWNVFCGQMSLVGPRPNVKRETDLYTSVEKRLLQVRPGITDIASIVFADEGEILANSKDPDIDYNQLIRPWKSRLALFYVENRSLMIDIQIILLTINAILSRECALVAVQKLLVKKGASEELIQVAGRKHPLLPFPPPGSAQVVQTRDEKLPEMSL